MTYRQGPLDYTALLIERAVSIKELVFDGRWTISDQWSVTGALARGWLHGTESNSRTVFDGEGMRVLTDYWEVGGRVRTFSYARDLNDGYFDPDFYMLTEVPVRWRHAPTRWSLRAELAPGIQKVGSDGSLEFALRGMGSASYQLRPGRSLGLELTYSNSGANAFATGDRNYRYFAIGLTANWVF